MKALTILGWLGQLCLSTIAVLAGFILAAVWLRSRFDLGIWVVLVGTGLGLVCAVDGLRASLKALSCLTGDKPEKKGPPPVSFNDHD